MMINGKQIGDRIKFDTQAHGKNGAPIKEWGVITAIYPKFYVVKTPFGYTTTVSRIVTRTEEDEEGRELKRKIDKLISMSEKTKAKAV